MSGGGGAKQEVENIAKVVCQLWPSYDDEFVDDDDSDNDDDDNNLLSNKEGGGSE